MLRSIESKLAGLVEGTFSRAFRSEVRPVEIARRLAREMEEHQTHSVSRVYVPNEYAVYLSPEDHERFADYEGALARELSGYLLEHARRERLALLARPSVELRTDDRLKLGEFGIQARLVQPPEREREQPRQGESGHTMIYSAAATGAEKLADPLEQRRGAPGTALLVVAGKRVVLEPPEAVVGRSRSSDVVVDDPNVSRHHAQLRERQGTWTIEDLESTNGVIVNGRRIRGAQELRTGDRVELGTSELRFEVE